MPQDSVEGLRSRLELVQQLLDETRRERDHLEAQLADAAAAQRELRALLLRQQEQLMNSQNAVSPAQAAQTMHAARVDPFAGLGDLGAGLPVESTGPGPREPTLREWWRDIDRPRRLGASFVLSSLASGALAIVLHFALVGHLIEPSLSLGYIFGLFGLVLFVIGVGLLF